MIGAGSQTRQKGGRSCTIDDTSGAGMKNTTKVVVHTWLTAFVMLLYIVSAGEKPSSEKLVWSEFAGQATEEISTMLVFR